MFERVAVVGAGVAGVAAVWAAARRGAKISLFDGALGASGLGGGAVDDRPWEQVARASEVLGVPPLAGSLPEDVRDFAEALGLWHLPAAGSHQVRLATAAGRLRVARGCDLSLLDLSGVPAGARIVLPRVARVEWDADALARSFSNDAYARSRGLAFEAVDADVLKRSGELRMASAELATRHDDGERLAWLAHSLRQMIDREGRVDAVLLGPWLGADAPRAAALSQQLDAKVGEVVGGVGSAAGLRFEAARARLLAKVGVSQRVSHVASIQRRDAELVIVPQDGGVQMVDAVVLALGGLAAGGIIYRPPEASAGQEIAPTGHPAFCLSLELTGADDEPQPVQPCFAAHGRRFDIGSSIHGPALDGLAWPTDADAGLLESIGVVAPEGAIDDGIYVAGDVVADQPRTLLQAAFSGLRAGARAAGEPGYF